ncbi:MAG: hypothetical protein IT374_21780 [Polyangiaceae bacterium]|nr:hypothetical protein [Polyangiaceae bacterium]
MDQKLESHFHKIEREHESGLTSRQILDLLAGLGVSFSEATLRKYVQQGLLPRSKRIGKKGKHQGSQGLYPASVVRQICRVRDMMARDLTIEQIQREVLFVRGDIEELERTLTKVFDALLEASESARGEPVARAVAVDIKGARRMASELIDRLSEIESRLIARAELARETG